MKIKEHRMGLALSRMKYGCELLSVTFPSCKNSIYKDGPLVQARLAGQEALVMLCTCPEQLWGTVQGCYAYSFLCLKCRSKDLQLVLRAWAARFLSTEPSLKLTNQSSICSSPFLNMNERDHLKNHILFQCSLSTVSNDIFSFSNSLPPSTPINLICFNLSKLGNYNPLFYAVQSCCTVVFWWVAQMYASVDHMFWKGFSELLPARPIRRNISTREKQWTDSSVTQLPQIVTWAWQFAFLIRDQHMVEKNQTERPATGVAVLNAQSLVSNMNHEEIQVEKVRALIGRTTWLGEHEETLHFRRLGRSF